MRKKNCSHFLSKMLIFTLVSVLMLTGAAPSLADPGDSVAEAVRDKDKNTAFITSKTAGWVDFDNYLAELTLTVNGTQVLEPLDVAVVLDRSGSMDMTYIGNRVKDEKAHNHGYPLASCPCLNQEHFYLSPVLKEVNPETAFNTGVIYYFYRTDRYLTLKYYPADSVWKSTGFSSGIEPEGIMAGLGYATTPYVKGDDGSTYMKQDDKWYAYGYAVDAQYPTLATADRTKGVPLPNGNLAVYRGDFDIWVEVNPASKTNLYFAFGEDIYIPYHFKMTGGEYQLISHWENIPAVGNTWRHAEESAGCFDRWIEAKEAISVFSEQLLAINDDNNVALIPFSIRDSTMVPHLNHSNITAFKENLIAGNAVHGYFGAATGTGISGTTITGTYNSIVSWTNDAADINDMLPRLFTTPNTDYMYGLSMAYNLLTERTAEAKATKNAVVLFISDGVPYSASATQYAGFAGGSTIVSFYNPDAHIQGLATAIKSDDAFVDAGGFWSMISSTTQRHDVKPAYLLNNNTGAPGLEADIITVGYMIDGGSAGQNRLKDMASNPDAYINVPPSAEGATASYLANQLLNSSVFPGGREAVLSDEISRYFYIPDNWDNPYDNVVVNGSQTGTQTVEWTIGDIYKYLTADEPSITIPLVLREEYRNVNRTTYYPTNNDPDPDLYNPDNEPDSPDTGAKLHYQDPFDIWRYDTIGTPKLPVPPPVYPYRVEYYKDSVDPANKLGNEDGYTEFIAGYILTSGDVAADLGPDWLNLYKTAGGTGYGNGALVGGYPIITVDVEKNVVIVVYVKTPVSLTLSGTKTTQGKALVDGQFNFAVYEGSALIARGTNTAAGAIIFEPIVYTRAGEHHYTVKETTASGGGWTADNTVYRVSVTVTDSTGALKVDQVAYPDGPLVFNNRYTSPREPVGENVTLQIEKSLVDADGNRTGDGKKFAVRLYDEHMNLVGRYILSANQPAVVITGLESGTTYYLQEEEYDGFTLLGFDIVGVGSINNSAVGLRIPTYEDNLLIEVVVTNRADDMEKIPDDDVPLAPYDPPVNPPLIDIPDEESPLSPPTGEFGNTAVWCWLLGLSAAGTVTFSTKKKRRCL